jgi:hypothetical protein
MPFIYSVKFLCGFQPAPDPNGHSPCASVQPARYSTEINIHNFDKEKKAKLEKSVLLLVRNGEAVGREPKTVRAEPFDTITLGPREATMDDCCLLGEKFQLKANTMSVGFLQIVSSIEVNVTAVYTASVAGGGLPPTGGSISIDVETIAGRKVA